MKTNTKPKKSNFLFYLNFMILAVFILNTEIGIAQEINYEKNMEAFRANYIATHDVVKEPDKQYLKFYTINKNFKIPAKFEILAQPMVFNMPTSSGSATEAHKIGYLLFEINQVQYKLAVYQLSFLLKTEKYKDHAFTPFTDTTSGIETYGGGRYLDFLITDFDAQDFSIDFNKAYNPSCMYAKGYSCPIPLSENDLSIAIEAGEKMYELQKKNNLH